MTTHALLLPQRISGLRTWCGLEKGDPRWEVDHVATVPEVLDCPECLACMRQALKNLNEWVPRLPNGEDSDGKIAR